MTHFLGHHTSTGDLQCIQLKVNNIDIEEALNTKLSPADIVGKQNTLVIENLSTSTFNGVTYANGGLSLTDDTLTYIPADMVDWTIDQNDTNIHVNNIPILNYASNALASNGSPGLSSYNFTQTRKEKLDNIESNAQVNVQSDWNASSGDTFIQNKPNVPSQLNELQDVDTSGVTNTNVLKYDSTSGHFVTDTVLLNEIDGINLTFFVNNELIRKDGASNSFVGADIITSTTETGGNTSQKTKFVSATPPLYAQLSSIESRRDGSVYSMIFNPYDGNAAQNGKFVLLSHNNNTRVGINVAIPTEAFDIDGNIKLASNNQSRIIFYDTQNDHEHAEIDALGKGTNGGQLIFSTKTDGGLVTEKMRITDDGGVGIGIVSPTAKLEVNGTIRGSNLITEGYLDLNPDGGLLYNAQLRHDKFIGSSKPDQVKMFLRNHAFWALQEGIGNGGDGTRKMIIDAPLEVNADIKGDNLFLGTNGQTPKIDMFFIDNANGTIWDTKIEIGKSDDFTNSPAFAPSNSYGMNVQANSDALFLGISTYDGGNNWRPLLKWGDDTTDTPFKIAYSSGTTYFDFETNGDFKMSGSNFYVNDIKHTTGSTSAYEIQPNLGWSGNSNTKALLALNQFTASLRVLNDTGAEITSMSPYKDGYIYYRGTLWNVSDDRLKSYETDVSNATDMVMKMKPKFYKKHPTLITDESEPDLTDVLHFDEYGFIAQELQEDPELSHFVKKNPETEIYHVNYVEMIPLLVQTIKELNDRIKVLESQT